MTWTAHACDVPAGSRAAALLPGATCCDAYRMADPMPQADALATYQAFMAHHPRWMRTLMGLRNAAVRPFGLKTGTLQGGLFSLMSQQPHEVVYTVDDSHLQVWISLHKHRDASGPWVTLSSIVRLHNAWGRVYLSVVWPAHQRIVPRLMQYAARHV